MPKIVIEPAAEALMMSCSPTPENGGVVALTSIAISLKRIADALDYGDDDTNFAEIVAEIAMNTRSIGQ
jgi:hypothetical protein